MFSTLRPRSLSSDLIGLPIYVRNVYIISRDPSSPLPLNRQDRRILYLREIACRIYQLAVAYYIKTLLVRVFNWGLARVGEQ